MEYKLSALVLISAILFTAVVTKAEEVKSLPGLGQKLNFRHYSGYFKVSPTHYLHYW